MAIEPNPTEEIFTAALERKPGSEREAFLQEICRSDAAMRERVEALLTASDAAGEFLQRPVLADGSISDESSVTEGPGTVIGRYKLLEKIGEGGMAVVYMAEQEQPLRRKVALKIIKLGMDTRQVIARFEAERQALAMMDHPCIAKVLDAGSTDTGRPYFVMELVQGVSITEYCDRNSLSTKDRLRLFLQVCHAVQHAHQKGIIHRDLKPSNVMVTHHDGKPVPKVIDFGIAKAINQKLTEKTLFTRYAHIVGTPAYMSPEQAELSDVDIDTRSDIYSLGVLLYELLTGTTPFSEEELRKAGYVEMQRVIREQEPVKPSTKLSTLGETLTDIAKCRNCTPDLLRKSVRGDLDWIVMKSLEKDRTHRYETASTLAMDVQRHLASEPVLARAPSMVYRTRKFFRRHRSGVLVALGMAVILIAAVVLLWQWNRDRQRLEEAQKLRDKGILSQAQGQYASGERDFALETIQPILLSKYIGPEAQLLQATILADKRRFDEARVILEILLEGRRDIAGAAHALLARILRESDNLDAQRLQEIENHSRQAETLSPETAEAYFSRAMAAMTIKDQLAALDKAVDLDSKHYEARRLRAFTYYASRKYGLMSEEAFAMQVLRDHDPLAHSLHATALRELGRYREAVAEYDRAISLPGQENAHYLDLTMQRCETLLRMGSYTRVIADAPKAMTRWPDRPVFQYYLFGALTAVGDYEKAAVVFQEIIHSSPTARNEFWFWATRYVFDTLEAGRSWHPPDRRPRGAAFLPLVEAEETYRKLSAKARRVVSGGFNAQWSPDGKKLAFSLGVYGYSGVALYDPATRETELLIVPGKDPRWSPDGRHIAFVRDCQALRLEELTTTERKELTRWASDEEVWVMNADGTEPRRLALGGWPSWGQDSAHIYFQSRLDEILYSISIAGPDIEPKQIMVCTSLFPSVSPDNRHVAYLESGSLKVKDLASQAAVADWYVPFSTWGGPAWSRTGRELCLGAGSSVGDRTGLWIYSLDGNEPTKVLTSQIMTGSWTPDGTKLVLALRPPYFELWTADLDPALSIVEALGPGQTLAEHWQDMLRLYARRIETDPQDAYAYSDRARYYDYVREKTKAGIDMKRWTAVMSGRSPSDLWFNTLRDVRWVQHLPFDCELVFSAERPVNSIPAMSVAFGQKGRCEMKLFEIPMVVISLCGLGVLSSSDGSSVYADVTFGKPVDVKTVIPAINYKHDEALILSYDGLEMYFDSDRPGCHGVADLWLIRRDSIDGEWGPVENLGPVVNAPAPAWEGAPTISVDGLTLYFCSNRSGGQGSVDLYMITRATKKDPWGPPVNLGPKVNSSSFESCPSISSDGLELYFQSNRPGGYGGFDVYVSRRATVNGPWGDAVNLGPVVNSAFNDTGLCLSPDGRLLLVQDYGTPRPGGYGGGDLWMTWRASPSNAWGPPVNLGPAINGPGMEACARISPDGSTLYFMTISGDIGTNWQAPIIPVADFNSDGKVDAADMDLLMANWGTNNSLYDIGPFAWGDGVVDERDLAVLMESLMTPGPKATDVPYDAVLSWTGPSFAQGYDVYFGTSFEDVSNATPDDPCGVLVSMGQTTSTYDPNGVLEFGRTYYWRIDTILGPSETDICKGPVLSFTAEAFAHPIRNIIARASSSVSGSGPDKTVDGSGLDTSDGHSTDLKTMWQSGNVSPHWIEFEFDKLYTLHELWVWNSNLTAEPSVGFGAKTVKIEYSTDGTTWTPLEGVPQFARAPGEPGYTADTKVGFGGVSAKYVKLTIDTNWGGLSPAVGLSEVRFFHIPERPATQP